MAILKAWIIKQTKMIIFSFTRFGKREVIELEKRMPAERKV